MFDAWPEACGGMAAGVWNKESPPSDNTFSGSCKDVQHINGDMHHCVVARASACIGRPASAAQLRPAPDGSAEKGEQSPSVSHRSVFQHHSWPESWGESGRKAQGGGEGAFSVWGSRRGRCGVDRVRTRASRKARSKLLSCVFTVAV